MVVKFYRPGRWSRDAIARRAPLPVRSARGRDPRLRAARLRRRRDAAQQVDGIHFAVWPRTGGRAPEELTDDEIAARAPARAHPQRGRDARGVGTRARLDAAARCARAAGAARGARLAAGFRGGRRYATAVERLARSTTTLQRRRPVHRIHGDCHRATCCAGARAGSSSTSTTSSSAPRCTTSGCWCPAATREARASARCWSRPTASSATSTRAGCDWWSRCAPSASSSTPPGSRGAGRTRPFPSPSRTSAPREYWETRDARPRGARRAAAARRRGGAGRAAPGGRRGGAGAHEQGPLLGPLSGAVGSYTASPWDPVSAAGQRITRRQRENSPSLLGTNPFS